MITSPAELLDLMADSRRTCPLAAKSVMPILVTADACELIQAAADSLPRSTLLHPEWVSSLDGALFYFVSAMNEGKSITSQVNGFTFGLERLRTAGIAALMIVAPDPSEGDDDLTARMVDAATEIWDYARPLGDLRPSDDVEHPEEINDVADRVHDRRLIAATILLAGQPKVMSTDNAVLYKAVRRRASKRLGSVPTIRILNLRSGHAGHGGESSRHLSKRFVVRGHWRNQTWGPSSSLRRPTWIAPHLKGPDGAPLDSRSTVWKLKADD